MGSGSATDTHSFHRGVTARQSTVADNNDAASTLEHPFRGVTARRITVPLVTATHRSATDSSHTALTSTYAHVNHARTHTRTHAHTHTHTHTHTLGTPVRVNTARQITVAVGESDAAPTHRSATQLADTTQEHENQVSSACHTHAGLRGPARRDAVGNCRPHHSAHAWDRTVGRSCGTRM
jgi:hypothetical protein